MLIIVHPVAAHVGEQLLHNSRQRASGQKVQTRLEGFGLQKESTNSDEWTKPRIPAKIRLGF